MLQHSERSERGREDPCDNNHMSDPPALGRVAHLLEEKKKVGQNIEYNHDYIFTIAWRI